ncbi:uncharacterized protein LOC117922923 isoform X1 [Vitis riparia]|uniref:uncharacterized protein LOC117922923 isoform X1 n=1 Tax=Vitis riparia TaxID=96939 RepID=UPI00053F7833|nr:uncharacterized protein LOC117922923 isoform X1 [Vitis riparia]XP_059595954.1 uncharacterized protein LOC100243438 isoform X1 [Vitis vinifera]|eukprot:XP_002266521.3 PREDICTED: uncharacterized protein LOC100243438 [Vitis vinifera]
MIPDQWTSPCGNQCTKKYAAMQIAWRVFCKKGCYADGETWEECLEECNEICYKDPVFKDQQWSAYIDRSPGSPSHSKECFNACVSGCGFKFEISPEEVAKVRSKRLPEPLTVQEPPPSTPMPMPTPTDGPCATTEDVPCTSA